MEETIFEKRRVVCKDEVLESIVGVPLVCASEFGLLCQEGLLLSMEKSEVVLLRGEGLVLSTGRGATKGEVEVKVGDCASVAGKLEANSVQACENVVCFNDVGAVPGDD